MLLRMPRSKRRPDLGGTEGGQIRCVNGVTSESNVGAAWIQELFSIGRQVPYRHPHPGDHEAKRPEASLVGWVWRPAIVRPSTDSNATVDEISGIGACPCVLLLPSRCHQNRLPRQHQIERRWLL